MLVLGSNDIQVLENVAMDYKFPANAGFGLFPVAEVGASSGKIGKFGKESFQLIDSGRAPGAEAKKVKDSLSTVNYSTQEYTLEDAIDDREIKEARNPAEQLLVSAKRRTIKVQQRIGLFVEKLQADLATNTSEYKSGHAISLSGTDMFDNADSDPIGTIEDAKELVRKAIGVRPNTLLIGANVWAKLKKHSIILDAIKHIMMPVATPDIIKNLLDLEKVVIGEAVYVDKDKETHDIWDKVVILAYVPSSPSIDEPAFGYTLRRTGYPEFKRYRDEGRNSEVISVSELLGTVLLGADAGAGVLFTNVIS